MCCQWYWSLLQFRQKLNTFQNQQVPSERGSGKPEKQIRIQAPFVLLEELNPIKPFLNWPPADGFHSREQSPRCPRHKALDPCSSSRWWGVLVLSGEVFQASPTRRRPSRSRTVRLCLCCVENGSVTCTLSILSYFLCFCLLKTGKTNEVELVVCSVRWSD